jgi:type II secretory pathway pseudopilin PulG
MAVVALMGIALPVVMAGIATSTAAAGVVKQRAAATELAENKLNEIILGQEWQTGALAGEAERDGLAYHWTAGVANNWNNLSNVAQLTIVVAWTGQGRPRSVALSTLVYQSPSSSQTGTIP